MAETTIVVHDLRIALEESLDPETPLKRLLAKRLDCSASSLPPFLIVKRALDSRGKHPIVVYSVNLRFQDGSSPQTTDGGSIQEYRLPYRNKWTLARKPDGPPPVVVGAGPAGLFAALTLAQAGWPPLIIERGAAVEERGRHVSALYARGRLQEESNVCFGEGGAGTYSDGKLYTRVNEALGWGVMRHLVEFGAPTHIEVDHRPHIGTDKLVNIVKTMRRHLLDLGAKYLFDTRVEDLQFKGTKLAGLIVNTGEKIDAPKVILAPGHSARALIRMLSAQGLPLRARPFAVGFRIEHPQALINALQYKTYANSDLLPAADYALRHQAGSSQSPRGVYSFCMCPGGVVVPTPTREDELCINGMSHASRQGRFANSALVVTLDPSDLEAWGYEGVLAGVDFQEACERRAYKAGGGQYRAPACLVKDFLQAKVSTDLGKTSYRRGLEPSDLRPLFPEPIIESLQAAFIAFESRMPGFGSSEARLIGVETRTASPVRCLRGKNGEAEGFEGLYPAGEGMGYGGGIASAAIDGVRAAEALLKSEGASCEKVLLEARV
jgi:uncharacterized protein